METISIELKKQESIVKCGAFCDALNKKVRFKLIKEYLRRIYIQYKKYHEKHNDFFINFDPF